MDIATLIGIVSGAFFVVTGIGFSSLYLFIDYPSVLIVGGGTVACLFMNFSLSNIKLIMAVTRKVIFEEKYDPNEVISSLVSFADKTRKEGLLALDDDVEKIEDEFLKKGIKLVVDGTDPELIRRIMETEMDYLDERHKIGKKMFESLGAYAPAFGMIGTLIGLIQMLANLDDPSAIGPGMAVALITTMYGSMLSNWIFLPLAGKLDEKHGTETMIKSIMVEGLLSIQAGDHTRIVSEKLKAFLPPAMREPGEGEGGSAPKEEE